MKYLLLTLLCSVSMAHSMEKRHSIEEMRQIVTSYKALDQILA